MKSLEQTNKQTTLVVTSPLPPLGAPLSAVAAAANAISAATFWSPLSYTNVPTTRMAKPTACDAHTSHRISNTTPYC
eukprot:4879629-Pyramimonas_sp.AAC.1